MKLDMHVHTENSPDSYQTLPEIAAECKKKGIDGVAVCDHDKAFTQVCIIDGIIFIPGIEISTEYGHLLGLFINSPVTPSRDFKTAAKSIKSAGGITVLAHPYESHRIKKSDVDLRIQNALLYIDGIEVMNSRASQFILDADALALEACKKYEKIRFAGSDGHTLSEIGSSYIEIDSKSLELCDIKSAIQKSTSVFSYGTSPCICTAKSQFIKLKKTGASPKKYIKFLMFSAKCVLFDILHPKPRKLKSI